MPLFRKGGFPVTFVLVASLGGLTMLAVILVSIASFEIARRNTVELTRDKAEMTLDAIEARIESHLNPVRTLMGEFAALIGEGRVPVGSDEELETAIRAALAATPQVSILGFVDRNLDFVGVFRNREGMPATRSSVRGDMGLEAAVVRAELAEEPFWGGLYYAESVDLAFLNVYAPVRDASGFIGMLLIGMSTNELSEFLGALDSEGSEVFINAFILYGHDSVLAHPLMMGSYPGLSDDQPLPAVEQFGDPVLHYIWDKEKSEAVEKAYVGRFQAHSLRQGGQDYVFIYRDLRDYGVVPWTIGTYVRSADIAAQAERLWWLPAIASVTLGVSLVIAILLGRALSRPVRALAGVAAKIRELDLEAVPALPPSRLSEMNQASDAFASMVAGLKAFEAYVPRNLVRELIAQHGQSGVPSEERELTVLFTDIAGFTARVESLPATRVAAFLNEHFSLIGGCVDDEGGTTDKYIGDALMAFWGAPVRQDDTAVRACRAALAMRTAIEADNRRREAAGLPSVGLRIGIHTGSVVVGNIGRPGRINYTVVGDTVNSCQRLESLGKEVGDKVSGDVTILISGATKAGLDGQFETEFLGDFAVKGRDNKIEAYLLLSGPSASDTHPAEA